MTNQILKALENVMKDSDRLEHLELHFSEDDQKLRGSTFKKDFVKNSLELIQFVSQEVRHRNFELVKSDSEVSLIINHPSKMVGFDALINIDQLNEEERKTIKWMDRFGHQVRYIDRPAQPTNRLMVIFRIEDKQLALKTIFPGHYAPAFSNEKLQTADEFQNSKKFWDQHVLIKS